MSVFCSTDLTITTEESEEWC